MLWIAARSGRAFLRLWRYWDRIRLDAQCIVERLCDDVRALRRAVMVAAAVRAPLEREGGGAHGGVMVLVTTMDTVFKGFKETAKTWSRYWPSPAFGHRSSDSASGGVQESGTLGETKAEAGGAGRSTGGRSACSVIAGRSVASGGTTCASVRSGADA